MIRYRIAEQIDVVRAVRCQHPAFARLAGCGPWTASNGSDGTMLTKGSATNWTAWRKRGDLEYQLADPMPPLDLAAFQRPNPIGEVIRLANGLTIRIKPASYDQALTLDDEIGDPVSEYGKLAESVFLRLLDGDIPYTDPELRALCFAAIRSNTTLTDELIAAWRLVSVGDIDGIVQAAISLPKVDPGGGGLPAALPGSIPAA